MPLTLGRRRAKRIDTIGSTTWGRGSEPEHLHSALSKSLFGYYALGQLTCPNGFPLTVPGWPCIIATAGAP